MANIGEGRAVTFCTLCRQADDHPKHVVALEDNALGRHMDCCRDAGCPTGACDVVLRDAKPKAGRGMLDHITKVHERRDVRAELDAYQEANPQLRQFELPGQQPVELTAVERRTP